MKESINVIEVLIFVYFGLKVLKFLFFRKKSKKHRKSILGKIWVLITMRLHSKLDGMIKTQKESLTDKNTQQDNGKVIEFKKPKGKKIQ